MIKEEYVTCETAKLLKKAGFPQYKSVTEYECCLRPTQAQAMRWLREEEVFVFIDGLDRAKVDGIKMYFRYRVGIRPYKYDKDLRGEYCTGYEPVKSTYYTITTYEAAAEAGIQAACEYLIEKQNQK